MGMDIGKAVYCIIDIKFWVKRFHLISYIRKTSWRLQCPLHSLNTHAVFFPKPFVSHQNFIQKNIFTFVLREATHFTWCISKGSK